MKRERLNEILTELSKKDESVETTALLEELRQGYTEDSAKEIENWENKYKELEKKYVETFRSNLVDAPEDNTPPTPSVEEKVVPPEASMTFDDMFEEIK